MNELLQSVEELRKMSEQELTQVGEDSLSNRLIEQGAEARQKHGTIGPGNMDAILSDPDCVRYPTRLVLEYGEMGVHQFAQPEQDYQNMEARGRILYIRPVLGRRPDMLAKAVAYMIPVINYGKLVTDEQCLDYAASLCDMPKETFYEEICKVADYTGSEPKFVEDGAGEGGGSGSGCGSGCGCG